MFYIAVININIRVVKMYINYVFIFCRWLSCAVIFYQFSDLDWDVGSHHVHSKCNGGLSSAQQRPLRLPVLHLALQSSTHCPSLFKLRDLEDDKFSVTWSQLSVCKTSIKK